MFIGDGANRTCYPACAPCCTDLDTVWVMSTPGENPKLYSNVQEALKGTAAPMVTAMRRTVKVPKESTGQNAHMRTAVTGGVDGAVRKGGEMRTLITDKEIEKARKDEAKQAEKMAIQESIENDRRKSERIAKKQAAAAKKQADLAA